MGSGYRFSSKAELIRLLLATGLGWPGTRVNGEAGAPPPARYRVGV